MTATHTAEQRSDTRVAGILAALTFSIYLASGQVLASVLGLSLWSVPVWGVTNAYPMWAPLVALAFGISGVAIALIVPTLAWIVAVSRPGLRTAALFHRAFATNLIQAVVFISVWKAFEGVVPPRAVFIGWQAVVTVVGLGLSWRRHRSLWPSRDGPRLVVVGGTVLLLCLPLFLWGKIAIENGSDDGTEQFEFSRSLATNQLPYWDLENDHYGFYPSFMLFAYPTQLSLIALGETEAAQRLPVFFYLLGIVLALAELIRRRRRALSSVEVGLLVGAATAFLLYHVTHSTYEVVADIAEPTGVDTFFTFLAAAAFYELTTRQRGWWAVFSVCGAMALAAGLPFALLFLLGRLVSRWPGLRWDAVRGHALDALAFIAPYVAYRTFVTIYASRYPLGTTKWSVDRIFDQYPIRVDTEVITAVVANLAVAVAVVPLLGVLGVRRDKIARSLALALAGYLATLIFFSRTHVHYVIPLCLFTVSIFLRALAQREVGRPLRIAGWSAYGASLAILLTIAGLSERTPHTAYRDFGARTLMLYDSYPDAVAAAEYLVTNRPGIYLHLPQGKPLRSGSMMSLALAPADPSDEPIYVTDVLERVVSAHNPASTDASPWGLLHHIWVRYADRAPVPGRRYHQIVAAERLAPAAVDGFERRDLSDDSVLFYRSGESIFTWLSAEPTTSQPRRSP